MEGVVDPQQLAPHSAGIQASGQSLESFRVAGERHRLHAVQRGDGDPIRLALDQGLRLGERQGDRQHLPARRGEVHRAAAMEDHANRIVQIERARQVGGGDLTHAVPDDRVRLDAPTTATTWPVRSVARRWRAWEIDVS